MIRGAWGQGLPAFGGFQGPSKNPTHRPSDEATSTACRTVGQQDTAAGTGHQVSEMLAKGATSGRRPDHAGAGMGMCCSWLASESRLLWATIGLWRVGGGLVVSGASLPGTGLQDHGGDAVHPGFPALSLLPRSLVRASLSQPSQPRRARFSLVGAGVGDWARGSPCPMEEGGLLC